MIAENSAEDTKCLVVSWFPGFDPSLLTCQSPNVEEVLEHIDSEMSYIKAIIWLLDDDEIVAVLLTNRSMDIYESARIWSSNSIDEWFSVRAGKYGDNRHYLRVVPDNRKSATRFAMNHFMLTGESLSDRNINLIFGMLEFTSKDATSGLADTIPEIGSKLRVALVDSDLINEDTPIDEMLSIIDSEKIDFGTLLFKIADISEEDTTAQ